MSQTRLDISVALGPVSRWHAVPSAYLLGLARAGAARRPIPTELRCWVHSFFALAAALAANAAAAQPCGCWGSRSAIIGACSTVGAQLSSISARFVPDRTSGDRAGHCHGRYLGRDHRRPHRRGPADGHGRMAGRPARVRAGMRRHRTCRVTDCCPAPPVCPRTVIWRRCAVCPACTGDSRRCALPRTRRPLVLRVLCGVGRPRRRTGPTAVLVSGRADRPLRPCRSAGHRRHPDRGCVDRPCGRTPCHVRSGLLVAALSAVAPAAGLSESSGHPCRPRQCSMPDSSPAPGWPTRARFWRSTRRAARAVQQRLHGGAASWGSSLGTAFGAAAVGWLGWPATAALTAVAIALAMLLTAGGRSGRGRTCGSSRTALVAHPG